MALNFTNTDSTRKNVNIMIYGRSGAGKTYLCGTAPKPIIISSEKDSLTIEGKSIPVIEISSYDDLVESHDVIKSQFKKRGWLTVCLDSLSDITEVVLADLKDQFKDPRQAYGELNTRMAKMIRKFRDLPINVYFICKAEVYETASGLQATRPSMPGKTLTTDIPYFFDIVLYIEAEEDEDTGKTNRYIRTRPTSTIEAKTRGSKLSRIEKPHLGKLFKKIKGGK